MTFSLATLHATLADLGMQSGRDDNGVMAMARAVTAEIQSLTMRSYFPTVATIPHDWKRGYATELLLDRDLLELDTITIEGKEQDLDRVLLLPPSPPHYGIRFIEGAGMYFTWTRLQSVHVAGTWGYHPNYAEAWQFVDDSILASMNTSTETMLVANALANDPYGNPWRLDVGSIIRAQDEFMLVRAAVIDPESFDTLTVTRGLFGSTPQTHSPGVLLRRYYPDPLAVQLCIEWTGWRYRNRSQRPADEPTTFNRRIAQLRRV